MSSRTVSFIKNSAGTAFMYFITMLSSFIVPRIMIGVYGSEINGLVSSITQFIAYFNLLGVGISSAVVWALYKPLAEKNYNLISSIVLAAKNRYKKAGIIFLLCIFALAILYPYFINVNSLSKTEVFLLVLVLGISGIVEIFTLANSQALLTADQKLYVISLASVAAIVLNTIIISLLSFLEVNIVIVRLVALLSIFTRTAIINFYIHKEYNFINSKVCCDNIQFDKLWPATLQQLLNIIQTGGPIVLATIFTDLKMVSVYTVFNLVINGMNSILSVFRSGVYAIFGNILAKGESDTLKKVYDEFELGYYIIVCVVYSVAAIMIMPFIRLYTKNITDINYDLPILGFLMVLNGLFINLKTPQNTMILAAGWYKETQRQNIIQCLILIIVGSVGGYYFGLIGIVLSGILSNVYTDINFAILVPRYLLRISNKITVLRMITVVLLYLSIVIMSQCDKLMINSFKYWILISTIVFIIVFIITLLVMLIFERKTVMGIYHRVISVTKKRK